MCRRNQKRKGIDGRTDKHHFPRRDSHSKMGFPIFGQIVYIMCFLLVTSYPTVFHQWLVCPIKFSVVKPVRRDYDSLISKEFELDLFKKQLGDERVRFAVSLQI